MDNYEPVLLWIICALMLCIILVQTEGGKEPVRDRSLDRYICYYYKARLSEQLRRWRRKL